MQNYRIYQVDAFTSERFCGNPAGVVPDAQGLSDEQMLAIARELNNSETAFVLPAKADDHDVWVRFFTPSGEVPICGHATIAAHYVRALEGSKASSMQLTGAGILGVEVERTGDSIGRIWMHQRDAKFGAILDEIEVTTLLEACGITADELTATTPVQIVSTGHSKVMIPLRSRAVLRTLSPDLGLLKSLSATIAMDRCLYGGRA